MWTCVAYTCLMDAGRASGTRTYGKNTGPVFVNPIEVNGESRAQTGPPLYSFCAWMR